jgi:hypothetical protein
MNQSTSLLTCTLCVTTKGVKPMNFSPAGVRRMIDRSRVQA